jgi:hypothetical protein
MVDMVEAMADASATG